jgi:hypothetical protein
VDRSATGDIRRYVAARFAERTFDKPILGIQVDAFPEAYHAIVRVSTSWDDIPYEMLDLAADVKDTLEERGYPVLVIVRPEPPSR